MSHQEMSRSTRRLKVRKSGVGKEAWKNIQIRTLGAELRTWEVREWEEFLCERNQSKGR